MKILQVSYDLNMGGLQRVVLDLADGLNAIGHETHIVSLRGHGPLEQEIKERGLPLWIMPWPKNGLDRWLFLKLFRLMRNESFDVVHTHNTQAFIDGGLAAAMARVEVRVHTDHARPFPDKLRYRVLEHMLAVTYDKVVGVSLPTAENLFRHERISRKKLTVIENGINGAWYRQKSREDDGTDAGIELRKRYGIEPDRLVFGLGVRLEKQKGIEFLLRAMPQIRERHPHALLVIAGAGSQEIPLRTLAESMGVSGSVRFLGPLTQLREFYPMLDVYVLPSLWEGLPLCLLEAMSVGLPIIATSVGGVGRLLTDHRNALLVQPSDSEALAQAVNSLLSNTSLAHSLGAAARSLFDARYDSSVMVKAYLDLYRCLAPLEVSQTG